MATRSDPFVIVGAILVLIVTAPAARSPQRFTAPQDQTPLATRGTDRRPSSEDRRRAPIAPEYAGAVATDGLSRPAPIMDDADRGSRVASGVSAQVSPGIAICAGGTIYDYQQNDLGQKRIATLGGDPGVAQVHFAWTHWDVVPESVGDAERYVNYAGINPVTGLCLGTCGQALSGAGGNAVLAHGGYATLDLQTDENAFVCFHQRNAENQPPQSDQAYSSYALDQGIQCFELFFDHELTGSNDAEATWPHGIVDRGGGAKVPGDDIFHVTAHPHQTSRPYFTDEIHYWRRVGISGAWEGPVVLDINAGPLNHYLAADAGSEHVACIYEQDNLDASELLQVVYMESATNGADWIATGTPVYPDPLTSHGFSCIPVTNYADPDGPQAWLEAGGEYDLDGALHVFWIEQLYADMAADCRLRHWSAATGFSTIAQAAGWSNGGDDGRRDLWIASPGLAFGDGQTNCSDGPPNAGPGGLNSNRNYIYCVFEQYGGESAAEQADHSALGGDGGPQMNLEIYVSCSNDGGATWSSPTNLTDTRTPGCDGTAGNECASERDPSVALVVNDAIHIQYILDTDAGDAVFGQGSWTFNPVMYYRIDGGADNKIPHGVCPEIAPSFAAHLTSQDPDCVSHATLTGGGVWVEDLIVENLGTATMTGSISVNYLSGTDWLNIVPANGYALSPGSSQTSSVTMNAGAASIQSGGEGVFQAEIEITHNDTSRPSPKIIPVDFFVFDQFNCPEYATLKTGTNSPGVLYLSVSNVENFAHQTSGMEGLGRFSDDGTGDSSYSIYDGTLLIALPPNPDTLVYRSSFGEGNGQPGFRALSPLVIDTGAYGTNAGSATAFAHQATIDSTIGVDVTYEFPQNADSSEFVLIHYRVFNRTASAIPGVVVGAAIDFDVTPGPDSIVRVQPGSQNTGHLREDYNLIYQQGVDSSGHAIVGNVTATRFKGGITAIQCTSVPRGWVAANDPWLFSRPGAGWHEGYLYQEMTKSGLAVFPDDVGNGPETDRHTVMVFEQDIDLTPSTVKRYTVGLVSSHTGTDETDIINTTKKAWKYAFGWQEYVDLDTVHINTAVSFPYYAVGTHESGPSGGCCGCIVTKVGGSSFLSVGGGEPGGCDGTIELAAGMSECDFPTSATFQVQDMCGNYSDQFTLRLFAYEAVNCCCPFQGDYDGDGFRTSLDLGVLIDVLFSGEPDVTDPPCPTSRSDFDFDGFPTSLDLGALVDHLFAGGGGPCSPCNAIESTCAQ